VAQREGATLRVDVPAHCPHDAVPHRDGSAQADLPPLPVSKQREQRVQQTRPSLPHHPSSLRQPHLRRELRADHGAVPVEAPGVVLGDGEPVHCVEGVHARPQRWRPAEGGAVTRRASAPEARLQPTVWSMTHESCRAVEAHALVEPHREAACIQTRRNPRLQQRRSEGKGAGAHEFTHTRMRGGPSAASSQVLAGLSPSMMLKMADTELDTKGCAAGRGWRRSGSRQPPRAPRRTCGRFSF